MVTLLYGYGLVFFISCLMGYRVTLWETAIVCGSAYLVSISFLRNRKRIGITFVALMTLAILGSVVVHYTGHFDWIKEQITDFFRPYYISMTDRDFSIDVLRQNVFILFIATVIYKIIAVVKDKKYSLSVFLILAFVLCIEGYLTNNLTSLRDSYGFVLFSAVNLLLYFYSFFIQHKASPGTIKNAFYPFAMISVLFMIVVIGISSMLYVRFPSPFELPEKKVVGGVSTLKSDQSVLNQIKEFYQYEVSEGGTISDEFKATGAEIFQVKAVQTKYLKGVVYEVYGDGAWHQGSEGLSIVTDDFTALPQKALEVEEVLVNYTKLQSNVIFVGGQGSQGLSIVNTIDLLKDNVRGTYSITDKRETTVAGGLQYSFQSIKNTVLDQQTIAVLNMNKQQTFDLSQTAYAMPEGYEDIQALAVDVTKDVQTEYDKVKAIIHYLSNNFEYSVKPDISNRMEIEPIRYFLFGNKEGFCQHFATSAILMMRSLNIPARYVRGYYVEETSLEEAMRYYDDFNMLVAPGYKIITDSGAHAWLEVYFPQTGWVMFDATPGFIIEEVEYMLPDIAETEPVVETKEASETTHNMKVLLVTFILIVMTIVIFGIINSAVRKHRSKKVKPSQKLKVYYGLISSYLGVIHLDKYPYETPREYSKRVDKKDYVYSTLKFHDLIESYEKVQYGLYDISMEEVEQYKVFLIDVKKEAIKYAGILRCSKMILKEFLKV